MIPASQYLIPMVQTAIPFVAGSPEGILKAPVGWLVCDGINGRLFQKTTTQELNTGWNLVNATGTLPFAWTTGAGDPNGSVSGNAGDHYTQVVSPTEIYEWIKGVNGGDTGWI